MSDLNNDEKINDLIEVLLAASEKGSKIEVLVPRDETLTIVVDHMPHDFTVEFDPHTQMWFMS